MKKLVLVLVLFCSSVVGSSRIPLEMGRPFDPDESSLDDLEQYVEKERVQQRQEKQLRREQAERNLKPILKQPGATTPVKRKISIENSDQELPGDNPKPGRYADYGKKPKDPSEPVEEPVIKIKEQPAPEPQETPEEQAAEQQKANKLLSNTFQNRLTAIQDLMPNSEDTLLDAIVNDKIAEVKIVSGRFVKLTTEFKDALSRVSDQAVKKDLQKRLNDLEKQAEEQQGSLNYFVNVAQGIQKLPETSVEKGQFAATMKKQLKAYIALKKQAEIALAKKDSVALEKIEIQMRDLYETIFRNQWHEEAIGELDISFLQGIKLSMNGVLEQIAKQQKQKLSVLKRIVFTVKTKARSGNWLHRSTTPTNIDRGFSLTGAKPNLLQRAGAVVRTAGSSAAGIMSRAKAVAGKILKKGSSS